MTYTERIQKAKSRMEYHKNKIKEGGSVVNYLKSKHEYSEAVKSLA